MGGGRRYKRRRTRVIKVSLPRRPHGNKVRLSAWTLRVARASLQDSVVYAIRGSPMAGCCNYRVCELLKGQDDKVGSAWQQTLSAGAALRRSEYSGPDLPTIYDGTWSLCRPSPIISSSSMLPLPPLPLVASSSTKRTPAVRCLSRCSSSFAPSTLRLSNSATRFLKGLAPAASNIRNDLREPEAEAWWSATLPSRSLLSGSAGKSALLRSTGIRAVLAGC
ncbi:hypothetical protein KC330_g131 [Hortaea werneckii]|nr:hypothetical protein KC330_g131 [Hortaea werneckii]